jgi:hypothetical protein
MWGMGLLGSSPTGIRVTVKQGVTLLHLFLLKALNLWESCPTHFTDEETEARKN